MLLDFRLDFFAYGLYVSSICTIGVYYVLRIPAGYGSGGNFGGFG